MLSLSWSIRRCKPDGASWGEGQTQCASGGQQDEDAKERLAQLATHLADQTSKPAQEGGGTQAGPLAAAPPGTIFGCRAAGGRTSWPHEWEMGNWRWRGLGLSCQALQGPWLLLTVALPPWRPCARQGWMTQHRQPHPQKHRRAEGDAGGGGRLGEQWRCTRTSRLDAVVAGYLFQRWTRVRGKRGMCWQQLDVSLTLDPAPHRTSAPGSACFMRLLRYIAEVR